MVESKYIETEKYALLKTVSKNVNEKIEDVCLSLMDCFGYGYFHDNDDEEDY